MRLKKNKILFHVSDYHPDIAIECFPQHTISKVRHHWRGIRFENAKFNRYLTMQNTFYVPFSESVLQYVDIRYAIFLYIFFYFLKLNLYCLFL